MFKQQRVSYFPELAGNPIEWNKMILTGAGRKRAVNVFSLGSLIFTHMQIQANFTP